MTTAPNVSSNSPGWQPYHLDYYAQEIVREYRGIKDVLNESHKMRMTVSYGLERFWGEHLRLKQDKSKKSKDKAKYWEAVWKKLHEILRDAGLTQFPDGNVQSRNMQEETEKIKEVVHQLWSMPLEDQRVALMVLTQFCDSLVWWTQRYKTEEK